MKKNIILGGTVLLLTATVVIFTQTRNRTTRTSDSVKVNIEAMADNEENGWNYTYEQSGITVTVHKQYDAWGHVVGVYEVHTPYTCCPASSSKSYCTPFTC